jgi:hypothetical protein
MKKLFTRSILAAGLGLALTAGSASAAPLIFTVDESVVPGATPFSLQADKITSSYTETLTFAGNNFTANLLVTFNGYDLGGVPQPNQVGPNSPGGEILDPGDYGLYALVTVTGTFEANPDPGDPNQTIFDFDPANASADVYLNPDQAPGGDLLILTASAIDASKSDGNVTTVTATGSVIGGDFSLVFTNAMTQGLGMTYWPDFTGLVLRATSTGDVDETSNVTLAGGQATGEASINFAPEPASMTLFGMTLLGAGLAARRRRSA